MNLNKVVFAGHLGKDPELKSLPSGGKVATFSVGSTQKFKGGDGSTKETTEWANCVAFGRVAEVLAQYLKKGSPIYLEGRMQTRNWEDKELAGRKLYRTELIVSGFQFIPTGQKSQNVDSQERPETEKVVQIGETSTSKSDDFDYGESINPDDIPF